MADMERRLLEEATVTRTAKELSEESSLSEHQHAQAVTALQKYGYCVLRQVLDPIKCCRWGDAVLADLDQVSSILLEQHEIDLRHPQESKCDPQSYRELAMREDLRMDLRDGPHLRKLRRTEHEHYALWGLPDDTPDHAPAVTLTRGSKDSCLRFHVDLLEIVKRTMNPTDPALFLGNFGRYNFEGSGPDGSPTPLRIGPMGGIVSLPGGADQAIHADTPHLFETIDCLPAHYINAFALGRKGEGECDTDGCFTGSTSVGGTAFVHGSHHLSFTAGLADDSTLSVAAHPMVLKNLVRPSLQLGDVLLFDCRVLHFGLANTSNTVERPMLYVNMTQSWFHDPKNWDDRQPIFSEQQLAGEE
jgi:hypothetical protein